MNKQTLIDQLTEKYHIVGTIDLDSIDYNATTFDLWIESQLIPLRKDEYQDNERIVCFLNQDYYRKNSTVGLKLQSLQKLLNLLDISSFFCVVVSANPDLAPQVAQLISTDPVSMQLLIDTKSEFRAIGIEKTHKEYKYASTELVGMDMDDLDQNEKFLLTQSNNFCIYPWIHIHAYPTGEAYPCCGADTRPGPIGDCRKSTLKEIWNSNGMKTLRTDMLSETWNPYCTRCYEQEKSGFFSMRQSANKHLGHHIDRVAKTQADGTVTDFELVYWDIRFSNLCNLSCRSCGYIFSSKWHKDQVKLMGKWAPKFIEENPVLNYAGRTETDMWEQLEPHLDYVEQIYFAGGEPLLMEEHYRILEELIARGRTDVKLVYNTNFTNTDLKGKSVFEYWKQFDSVAVGASLDGMDHYGEYIRKGTDWGQIVRNRYEMLSVCPKVDFYISPTLSIMNAWHLPDFHREWVAQDLLRAQDLNINILQDPTHYRIDIAPLEYKQQLTTKYRQHLDWLSDRDPLHRATQGFESAITFMNATDNTYLIDTFWQKTHELDAIRNENILNVIPELIALK